MWIAIGAALTGLMVGLWLRSLFVAVDNFTKKQEVVKQTQILKDELGDQAMKILNDPTISKEDREKIQKLMKEFGLGF